MVPVHLRVKTVRPSTRPLTVTTNAPSAMPVRNTRKGPGNPPGTSTTKVSSGRRAVREPKTWFTSMPGGTKPARRTPSGMTTSGHTGPRAAISTVLRWTENSSITRRRCVEMVALCPGSRWPRVAPAASTSCTVPARVQHAKLPSRRCSAPMRPSCAIAAWVLDARDTVPRPPSRLAIRAQTVPAVMRTWMRERSRSPTSISRTVTSELGSTVTVVPSRKVISARLAAAVRMRSPTDRLVPVGATARPPSGRTSSTTPPSTVKVAAVETVGDGAWARADAGRDA